MKLLPYYAAQPHETNAEYEERVAAQAGVPLEGGA